MNIRDTIIIYLLNVYDYIMTTHFIKLYGVHIEMNPIGKWLYDNQFAFIFKIVIMAFMLIGVCELSMIVDDKSRKVLNILSKIILAIFTSIALLHTILFIVEQCIMLK